MKLLALLIASFAAQLVFAQQPVRLLLMNGKYLEVYQLDDSSYVPLQYKYDANYYKKQRINLKVARKQGEFYTPTFTTPKAESMPIVLKNGSVDREEVFSIQYPAGGWMKVFYYYDEPMGIISAKIRCVHFVYGERDARNFHRGKSMVLFRFGSRACGTGYGLKTSVVSLAVPPLFALTAKIPSIRIKDQYIADKAYKYNEDYASGFESYARSRNMLQALKGSAIGTLVGIIAYSIVDNNQMKAFSENLKKFLFWIGDTNIFIAIAAAFCTLATYEFHSVEPDYFLVGFIFFATLFTYNLQRRVGDLESTGTHYIAKTILMGIGLAGLMYFAFYLTVKELIGLGLAGALSMGYAIPCIPFREKWRSIREIPYMKIWVIVLAWLMSTSIVPLIDIVNLYSVDDRWSTVLFFLQQGAFIWALTIPFDVRDLKSDFPHQRTLPMVFGVSRAIKMAQNAMILAFVFAFFNYLIGFFGFPEMLVQLGISIVGVMLVRRGSKHRLPLYYSILLDGMIILQGLAVVLI